MHGAAIWVITKGNSECTTFPPGIPQSKLNAAQNPGKPLSTESESQEKPLALLGDQERESLILRESTEIFPDFFPLHSLIESHRNQNSERRGRLWLVELWPQENGVHLHCFFFSFYTWTQIWHTCECGWQNRVNKTLDFWLEDRKGSPCNPESNREVMEREEPRKETP